MTRQESYAMAAILTLLLLGTLLKSIQKRTFLFDSTIYEATDSLFAAATLEMNERLQAPDSVGKVSTNQAAPDSLTELKQVLIANGKININTASQTDLERLPRIGPAMAQRIIAYRQTHGPFEKIDDLEHVKGIGPKTLERLKPEVTLRSAR